MIEYKRVVYRLYPTKCQEQTLKQMVGNSRFVWNLMLGLNKEYYSVFKEFIFHFDMCKILPIYREMYPFLQESTAQSLGQTCKELDQALRSCFRSGFGFPKFKKKNQRRDSFGVPQQFEVKRHSIKLFKLGCVKIDKHQPLQGKPKNITVYRDGDKWFAAICVEFEPQKLKKTGREIGLDLGTKRLATGSSGQVKKSFGSLKSTKKLIAKIKSIQRHLSRQKQGSNSWEKTKYALGKLMRKLSNKRKDRLHKFSRLLVERFDFIAVEDLQTQRMTKSNRGTGKNVQAKAKLNNSILTEGWSEFIRQLEYKCRWYGKTLVKVDPAYTSQYCSCCGYVDKRSRRSQEEFKCTNCGFEINADHNAAKNILFFGKLAA